LELAITYRRESVLQHGPWTGHLHHLVHLPDWSIVENPFQSKDQQMDAYFFGCSYPTCSAVVSLKLSSPLLTSKWVDLLTDTELLKQRTDEAMAARPERLEGLNRPLPINVLINLRTYIENTLDDKHRSKAISSENKRFMVCFGVGGRPCKELLEFLEFSSRVDISNSVLKFIVTVSKDHSNLSWSFI
jgi:ubiquitin carboxyl-terminal hydrolase 25/28